MWVTCSGWLGGNSAPWWQAEESRAEGPSWGLEQLRLGCERVGRGRTEIGAANNCPEERAVGSCHRRRSPPRPAQTGRSQSEPACY